MAKFGYQQALREFHRVSPAWFETSWSFLEAIDAGDFFAFAEKIFKSVQIDSLEPITLPTCDQALKSKKDGYPILFVSNTSDGTTDCNLKLPSYLADRYSSSLIANALCQYCTGKLLPLLGYEVYLNWEEQIVTDSLGEYELRLGQQLFVDAPINSVTQRKINFLEYNHFVNHTYFRFKDSSITTLPV